MRLIPLSPLPNQRFSVILDDQNVTITLKQNGGAVYLSLECNQELVVSGHICNNDIPMPIFKTTKFKGLLAFHDSLGKSHPHYEGFGTRYLLVYLSEDEKWPL